MSYDGKTYMAIDCDGGEVLYAILHFVTDSDSVKWERRDHNFYIEFEDYEHWITSNIIEYLTALIDEGDSIGSYFTKIYSTSDDGNYFLTYITPRSVDIVVRNGEIVTTSIPLHEVLNSMCPMLNIAPVVEHEEASKDTYIPFNIF